MKSTSLVKLAVLGAVLVGAGVGTYAVIERLEDATFHVLVGAAAVLTVVIVVGLLFVVRDALQARIFRKQMDLDNYHDLKQMATIFKLMGGNRAPNVNVKLPEQGQQWPYLLQSPQQQSFDGAYRDTTVDSEIEIE